MKREEFIQWLQRRGYKDQRGYGRFRKEGKNGKIYAFKVSKIAARYEVQVIHETSKSWVRLRSGYFKDLSLTEDDKLLGMKR